MESNPDEFIDLNIKELVLEKNPISMLKKIPVSINRLNLQETNITVITAEVLKLRANIYISNYKDKIELPNPDDIAPYYGKKSIYFNNMSESELAVIDAINEKYIG